MKGEVVTTQVVSEGGTVGAAPEIVLRLEPEEAFNLRVVVSGIPNAQEKLGKTDPHNPREVGVVQKIRDLLNTAGLTLETALPAYHKRKAAIDAQEPPDGKELVANLHERIKSLIEECSSRTKELCETRRRLEIAQKLRDIYSESAQRNREWALRMSQQRNEAREAAKLAGPPAEGEGKTYAIFSKSEGGFYRDSGDVRGFAVGTVDGATTFDEVSQVLAEIAGAPGVFGEIDDMEIIVVKEQVQGALW